MGEDELRAGYYGGKGCWGYCLRLSTGWRGNSRWLDRLLHGDAHLIAWRTYWYGLESLAFGWRSDRSPFADVAPFTRVVVDIGPFAFEVRR